MISQANQLQVQVATGDALDARWFSVSQAMDQLFCAEIHVVSKNLSVSLEEVIGAEASFSIRTKGARHVLYGVAAEMVQLRVDEDGVATYKLILRPRAWLLTQRKNYRIFQYQSEIAIVRQLLAEWGIEHEVILGREHKPRKYRVQYDESDFAFACRMLEDAGIAYFFQPTDAGTKLVLCDQPERADVTFPLLPFHDSPQVTGGDFVTDVRVRQRVKPGTSTIGDLDYRRPSTSQPRLSKNAGLPVEAALEQFDYEPGAFLFQGAAGGSSPAADDRGAARTDEASGTDRTETRLYAARRGDKIVAVQSNVLGLAPGIVFSIANHPHRVVGLGAQVLVTSTELSGAHDADWRIKVEAVSTGVPYRPMRCTPKPRVPGLESATVVGPSGEEIHTDEYGRVRVHFHWDRESNRSDKSSCWLPTSQPWAGTSFGGVNLPRVGQEVLVQFLGGDPDRPVVIGRLYTEMNPPPDKLPGFKHVSGIMSESTPRLIMGGAGEPGASAPDSILGGGKPMSPEEIASEVQGNGPYAAKSPTGAIHEWPGSGIKFSDADGQQSIYLQAQKDLNITVNNAWRTIVKADRSCKVGSDDILEVGGRHVVIMKGNQTVEIKGEQYLSTSEARAEEIQGTMSLDVDKSFECTSDLDINYTAKQLLSIEAKNRIELVSKGGSIVLTKDSIVVTAADVFVQPGEGGFKKGK